MGRIEAESPNPIQRAVRRLIALRPSAWLLSRTIHPIDSTVFRASRGRITASSVFTGLPILSVTTIGARSGQPRAVTLVGIPDGERIILVASNWGQQKNPAWYHNVKANPEVRVAHDGRGDVPAERLYVARELAGAEREAAWGRAVALYPGYRGYAARAGRDIPIISLEPATAAAADLNRRQENRL